MAPPASLPKVLLVDDRPDNLLALEAVLEPLACETVRAGSGDEALRRLLHDDFAVILLDVQMPGLDGYDTARHIKERKRTRNVPLIFLTAIDREMHHQLRGYGAGAVDFIAKPFEPQILVSKVGVFLDLYNQSRVIADQNERLGVQLADIDRARQTLSLQAKELQRSNAELERFALAASEQLAEPLQLVRGFIDIVRSRLTDTTSDDICMSLEAAERQASMTTAILNELLAYARVSAGHLELRPVDLNEAFKGACRELEAQLVKVDARVTADPLPVVAGDEWQLRRVFFELIDNAAKFCDDQPIVHVAVSRREQEWVITVQDNGVGVVPDELVRMFTLFGRGAAAHGVPGSGLGLATCKRTIERHGGRMWAESVSGQGSAVSFTLPAVGA